MPAFPSRNRAAPLLLEAAGCPRYGRSIRVSGKDCPMFYGSITALITPFRNGEVDETAFQRFVDWQVREGTDALVPCGTTGESPTLSHSEHMRVVDLCVEAAAGRARPAAASTHRS